ncbi:unnamed protein product [Cylindrotheca closterium]|uniref:Uncharacterized protein n=1 Tax=Cylindrotheca closterium TaxID=2856 RepID=A0AAD2CMM4_9STRA|nr:unnamed protein product [Cylindrotheca closterium]
MKCKTFFHTPALLAQIKILQKPSTAAITTTRTTTVTPALRSDWGTFKGTSNQEEIAGWAKHLASANLLGGNGQQEQVPARPEQRNQEQEQQEQDEQQEQMPACPEQGNQVHDQAQQGVQ